MSLVMPHEVTDAPRVPEDILPKLIRDLQIIRDGEDVGLPVVTGAEVEQVAVAYGSPVPQDAPQERTQELEMSAAQEVRLWARPLGQDLSVPLLKSLGTPYLRYFAFVEG